MAGVTGRRSDYRDRLLTNAAAASADASLEMLEEGGCPSPIVLDASRFAIRALPREINRTVAD